MGSKRRMVYVAGLEQAVSEETLHAAFIPFGNIREVSIPKDFKENKHRGFGFVDFEEEEDAQAAIDNMDGAEILGRVLRCNFAKADTKLQHGKAIWSAEEWIQNSLKGSGGQEQSRAAAEEH